ncbi:MAG: alpha-L-fucosidase [Micropruina sp.]|uniref:alpha-L-fucosidase n=1 Tax=Micropruina sp. TaxID=2737536 RepID=UPI0039E548E4
MTQTSALPVATPQQLAWQQLGVGMFVHFGMNTFHGVEWSDGTLPAESFAPSELNADEWVEVAVAMGARYLVLTTKHHDGFCLWPTATTDYSVASSPWRQGRGDVVRDVAEACARAGIGLGLYLSPWDRNHPAYSDPDRYAEVYRQQVTELCTGYGPIVEFWFDGAGSEGYRYRWDEVMEVIHRHQGDAMVFNMGNPTIRWVGNENGLASDPVEYVVDHGQMSNYTVETIDYAEALYLPPECDVSLRRGWFWASDDEPKTLDHLMAVYYGSVGLGAGLLLNVPPDRRGRIDPADAARVREFGAEVERRFGRPTPLRLTQLAPGRWRARTEDGRPVDFDHVELAEDLIGGQRITGHRIVLDGRVVAQGLTVGVRRLHLLGESVSAAEFEIELSGRDIDGAGPALASAAVHRTGVLTPPAIPDGYLAPTEYPE